jgi:flagellar biosynthesis GTPase FlhF
VHNITDTNKLDKMGETAWTASRIGQKPVHTAMDYALRTQEVNTEILRRTSQVWIEGFRYQARLSQGMAQMFFGQWGAAFKSMPLVDLPGQEQSGPEVIELATNGAQKVTGPAAKDVQEDIEKAEKVAKEKQRAEKQEAEKVAREKKATEVAAKDAQKKADKKKAEKKAEIQQAEKVAKDTRKAEEAAEETQKKTEIAAESARKSAEPAAQETQKSTEVAAKDAQETQKSTEIAAKDAQKNTETAAFPIEGYDGMNVGEVFERLDGLSEAELKRVGEYEKDNKDRGTLRKEMEQKTGTTS